MQVSRSPGDKPHRKKKAAYPPPLLETKKANGRRSHDKTLWQIDDLNFSGLRQRHIAWLQESIPTAKITSEMVKNARYMPAYRCGKWDGMSTYVEFQKKSDAVLFKLRWWK